MGETNYRWMSIGQTHVLFELQDHNPIPEWQPVAQVTLRQVYEGQTPQWYVWWLIPTDGASNHCFDHEEKAIGFAERHFDCVGQTKRIPLA